MRILLSSLTYAPQLNGQSIFVQNLAEGMAAQGHEVLTLTAGGPGLPPQQRQNGVRVLRLPALHLGFIHKDLWLPLPLRQFIWETIDQFQPQVVHVHDPSPLGQAVAVAARRRRIPLIITHHTGPAVTAPYLRLRQTAVKQVVDDVAWKAVIAHLNQANLVTVPSNYSATMLQKQGLRAPVRVIPCGVQRNVFRPDLCVDRVAGRRQYGLDPQKCLFLYTGRLDVEKNLEIVLQAAAMVEEPDIELAIAGYGPVEAHLRELAARAAKPERFHFLGQVSHTALPALLNIADVFVMPGAVESFSIATLEAMACARPIIAANASALPELVEEGVNGFLFQPDQPEAIAQAMTTLAVCQTQRQAMGQASLVKAEAYSLERLQAAYEQVYRAAISDATQSAASSVPKRPSAWGTRTPGRVSGWGRRGLSRVALTLVAVFFLSTFFYDWAQAMSNVRLADLSPLTVKDGANLLVIAPHPDDEVLAVGGLIQRVLAGNGRVAIVLITNGDGQYLAPLAADGRISHNPIAYITLGQRRQAETISALKQLGVGEASIYFLGYPDGRLQDLWLSSWPTATPVTAPYTRASKSPYDNNYNPDAIYRGLDLSSDLTAILQEFQPDIVAIPHPLDTHPDHAAVSHFAQFTLAYYLPPPGGAFPTVLGYLIHYEAYPLPRGANTSKLLLPPAPLANRGRGWLTYVLSDEERAHKMQAIGFYTSQRATMGFLRSFARANEIFFTLPGIHVPAIGLESQELMEKSLRDETTLLEPARERFSRLMLAGGDLDSWWLMRLGDTLCLGGTTRGRVNKAIEYRVLIKLPDGETLISSSHGNDGATWLANRQFGTCITLDEPGDLPVIGFATETRYGVLLDRTAWHFVRLE